MKYQPLQSHKEMYHRLSNMANVVQDKINRSSNPDPEWIVTRDSLKALAHRHYLAMVTLPPQCDTYYSVR